MKISTIDQVNIIGSCCQCELPECDQARQECEAIFFTACGWTIEDLLTPEEFSGVSEEEKKRKYLVRNDTEQRSGSGVQLYDAGAGDSYTTATINANFTTSRIYDFKPASGADCVVDNYTTAYDFQDYFTRKVSDNSLIQHDISTFTSTSSPSSPCSGTFSGTSEDLSGTTPILYPLDYCPIIQNDVDVDWFVSGTSFSSQESTTPSEDPNITYVETTTYSTTLDQPVTLEYMLGVIKNIDFKDNVNSTVCSSFVRMDSEVPDQPYQVQKLRYRFGVPEGYERSTWEMQWDEVFFPKAYDDWVEDGSVGDPPEDSLPTLVESRDWIWGGNAQEPWSEWYSVDPPDEEGEVRIVNIMVICWKSSRIGQKPTAYGEVYEFPET